MKKPKNDNMVGGLKCASTNFAGLSGVIAVTQFENKRIVSLSASIDRYKIYTERKNYGRQNS